MKLVEWHTNTAWIDDDTEPFAFLLNRYGRYLDSDEYADFRVYNYIDISVDRTWTFYDYLEPLTIHYDGGISLHGLAWARRRAVVNSASARPGTGSFSVGGSCNGRPAPGWKSIMRYPCACTMQRAKGSTKRITSYGKPTNHTPTGQWSADEVVEVAGPTWTFPAILPGDTSCAWSSTISRRKRRLSRWVFGSRRRSWRACG